MVLTNDKLKDPLIKTYMVKVRLVRYAETAISGYMAEEDVKKMCTLLGAVERIITLDLYHPSKNRTITHHINMDNILSIDTYRSDGPNDTKRTRKELYTKGLNNPEFVKDFLKVISNEDKVDYKAILAARTKPSMEENVTNIKEYTEAELEEVMKEMSKDELDPFSNYRYNTDPEYRKKVAFILEMMANNLKEDL